MAIFLIIVLAIAVLVIWRSGQNSADKLRGDIEGLQRDVSFLRDRVAWLVKQSAPAPPTPAAEPNPVRLQPQEPVTPPVHAQPQAAPAAQHAPPAPVQPLRQPSAVIYHSPTPPAPTLVAPPPIAPPPIQPPTPPSPPPNPVFAAPLPSWPPSKEEARAASFSLEERLGANWLNKLGIAILVIGIAFFLAYELQTWGPVGKVACGYAVGLAMLAGGVWLERKPTYRIFARGGIGGGWALTFFTTYAMHHLDAARVVNSLVLDLVLMLLVAAGMVAHSLRYNSQTVTGLAFGLGFGTLLTSHLESPGTTVVFSLMASVVLAVALVIVTTLRHWAWLELAGLITVYLSHFVWLTQVLPDNRAAFTEFWPSTALILIYWLIFRLAYVFRTPLNQSEENLSSLSAVFNSIGVLGLLKYQSAHPEWAFWALIALGVLEMLLAFIVRRRRRQAFVVLSTIATVLLISAVPFRFHGVTWPVLWLVQAQVLAIAGLRLNEPVFRRLGLIAGLLTGGVLAFKDVLPLFLSRLFSGDSGPHSSLTVALVLAATLYWIHAEIYPRRWPRIVDGSLEALALSITSWLGAGAAATALWVAVPDLWLPVSWLALVLVLAFAAHRFSAIRLALEADLLALGSAAVLICAQIGPLALLRLNQSDPSRHAHLTTVLALAAIAFWFRSELYTRVLPRLIPAPPSTFDASSWQSAMLPALSFIGTGMGAASLWAVLPSPWVIVGWLALVLLLGLAADWINAQTLALQADVLAIASAAGLFPWDLSTKGWWDHKAPLIAAVLLLYAGMRRKTVLTGSPNYVAPVYSWAATLSLAFVASVLSSDEFLGPAWALLGLALFEIGRFTRKGFLRWQGYFLVAVAFLRFFVAELFSPDRAAPIALSANGTLHNSHSFSLIYSLLMEVLVLALAGYLLFERTRNRDRSTRKEHIVGLALDALGTLSIALWFAYRFPSTWVPVPDGEVWVTAIWAAIATVLLALAWLMRRKTFLVQAIVLAIAVPARGVILDLFADSPDGFWNGPLFHLAVAVILLLAALPFAFQLRNTDRFGESSIPLPSDLGMVVRHPEQVFFFSAFALEVLALAFKLSSGRITIAWSLLGLGVFLFAMLVGERSFRLAGLGLLLVSVAKIIFMDVWKLSPTDRFITLIVLGLALVIVSFLYTRFAAIFRKLL